MREGVEEETEGRSKHVRSGTGGDNWKEQNCRREGVEEETEGRSKHVREKGYRRQRE